MPKTKISKREQKIIAFTMGAITSRHEINYTHEEILEQTELIKNRLNKEFISSKKK